MEETMPEAKEKLQEQETQEVSVEVEEAPQDTLSDDPEVEQHQKERPLEEVEQEAKQAEPVKNEGELEEYSEGGKEKLIHFGAKGYGHNYSAAARKSFKARHRCGTAKSKLTARYWSCKKLWAGKGGSTKSNPKGVRGKY